MEALSCLLKRAVEGNYFTGSRVADWGGEELNISHLLCADDTLLFFEANKEQMMFMSWTLMWFEALLGLRINLNKSDVGW